MKIRTEILFRFQQLLFSLLSPALSPVAAGYIFPCILILSTASPVLAQPLSTQEIIEDHIERRYPETSSPAAETYRMMLEELVRNPPDLNHASALDLARVPGLDYGRARAIVAYREDVKLLESVGELGEVKGIGGRTVRRIQPFVTINSDGELGRQLLGDPGFWTHNDRLTIFSRYRRLLQVRDGYRKDDDGSRTYLGNPVQYYHRVHYASSHLSMNLTQQKDAGEPHRTLHGFDFTSAHLAFRDVGMVKNLVLGDFDVRSGEGLIFGGGNMMGKGRNVVSTPISLRRTTSITGYKSSREYGFFRGLASEVQWGDSEQYRLALFHARSPRDATPLAGDTLRLTSPTGYHRTSTETARRKTLLQRTTGGTARYQFPFGSFGIAGYSTGYDRPIAARIPGTRFTFNPARQWGIGLDYQWGREAWQGSGEIAINQRNAAAVIHGLQRSLDPNTDLLISFRHYHPYFNAPFGSGFGESGGANETGLYMGITHRPLPWLEIAGYFDQHHFPAPRYATSQPTHGYDWLAELRFHPIPHAEGYIQIKNDQRDQEIEVRDPYGKSYRKIIPRKKLKARLHLQYQATPEIRLRTRFAWTHAQPAMEPVQHGYLLYQDLRVQLASALQLDARLTLFDTADYDSRLYQFENDLLYVMTNTMLHGMGQRSYLLFNWKPFPQLELWAKYAATVYEHQHQIGSGPARITGNRKSKLSFQVRLVF